MVELAVVEKKEVVVALVVVLFTAVKFWRVVEPVERRLARVASPVTFRVEERVVAPPTASVPKEALFDTTNDVVVA